MKHKPSSKRVSIEKKWNCTVREGEGNNMRACAHTHIHTHTHTHILTYTCIHTYLLCVEGKRTLGEVETLGNNGVQLTNALTTLTKDKLYIGERVCVRERERGERI
jgi:hypothetical protein